MYIYMYIHVTRVTIINILWFVIVRLRYINSFTTRCTPFSQFDHVITNYGCIVSCGGGTNTTLEIRNPAPILEVIRIAIIERRRDVRPEKGGQTVHPEAAREATARLCSQFGARPLDGRAINRRERGCVRGPVMRSY